MLGLPMKGDARHQKRREGTPGKFFLRGLCVLSSALTLGCGDTPLHEAARSADANQVIRLLEDGVNADARGQWQNTALHVIRSEQVAKLLIAGGADVDARNCTGNTPLHIIAYRGYPRVAKQLIAGGAEINAVNDWGDTPLILTSDTIIDHGLEENGITDEMRQDAPEARRAVAKLLLKQGANVNAQNRWGETALYVAVEDPDYFETVRLLLDHGADPSIPDLDGQTPLASHLESIRHRGPGYSAQPEIENLLREKAAKGTDPDLGARLPEQ